MRNFIILLLLLIEIIPLYSQASKPYQKKVVSFVDKIVTAPTSIRLSEKQIRYIQEEIAESMTFARFQYIPLPNAVVASFNNDVSTLVHPNPESLKPIIEKTLAPQLLKLLDTKKELLSKQNLSEVDRNTFLATKAQAAGLTAQQLEAILNSGFFYIPYISLYERTTEQKKREVKDEKGKVVRKIHYTVYKHALQLGLLWYKLNVDKGNTTSITFINLAQGGIVEQSISEDNDDETPTADAEAFQSVVKLNCFNIQLATKKMDAFRLYGEVTETTASGLKLNLGTREDVRLDDTYWIEELQETELGEIVTVKRGFVKIREVGDNINDETAQSYAQTITGTNYSHGLSATELTLLGINGLFGFTRFPVSLLPFNNSFQKFSLSQDDFYLTIHSESTTAYGAMLSVQTNLAHATNISELWGSISGAIGVTNIDGTLYIPKANSSIVDSSDIGISLTGYVTVGILKKFYFRRFGFFIQGDIKYSRTRLSSKGSDEKEYILENDNIGLGGKLGLETYISPIFSIGAAAEYNLFGEGNGWTVSVEKGKDILAKNKDAIGPIINYSGLGFYVWINYSLPSF